MNDSNRYQTISEIGRGAMGVVYLAFDTMMDREVALKVLSLAPSLKEKDREELVARFMREAQAAGRLSGHPNIITTHDVGEQDGMFFIAMEVVRGEPLTKVIERGPLPFTEVIDIMLQLCNAMDYAHSRGVIHRDLKPENIFVLPDGMVKVGDFGIARVLSKGTVTEVGTIIGTPGYMSPEQIRGQQVRPVSDIFAAGVILYELLIGVNPFEYGLDEPSYAAIIHRVVYDDPVPLVEIDPEIPREFDLIVSRAIEKNPADRYANSRQFLGDMLVMSNKYPGFDYHTRRELISDGLIAARPPGELQEQVRRLTLRRKADEPVLGEAELRDEVASDLPPAHVGEETLEGVLTEEPAQEEAREEEEEPESVATELEPEEHEFAERKGNLRKVVVPAAIFVLVILGLSLFLYFTIGKSGKSASAKVTVPQVIGLNKDNAKSEIEKAGFKFGLEYKANNTVDEGKVFDQSPGANKKAPKGSTVAVLVAVKGKVDVPDVTGASQDQAISAIQKNFLNYKLTQQSIGDQNQHGIILLQDPAAGTKLDAGAEVAMVVGVYQAPPAPQPPAPTPPTQPTQPTQPTRKQVACSRCGGSGKITVTYQEQVNTTCPTCGGSGWIQDPSGLQTKCPQCGGSGHITQTVTRTRQDTCPACEGKGWIWSQ